LVIDVHSGGNLPDNINDYAFIVQCGSCMLNRNQSLYTLNLLKEKNIAITNFGLLLNYLN
ncbi:MAG: hypothetical protein FWE37_07725, partial [Spirochaetaceae bacterium]|nr:hypothetical protein [Spirochaetaceae bacterium]